MNPQLDRFLADFAQRSDRAVKRSGTNWIASCPCDGHEHGDRKPSLSISEGRDQPVVVYCHAHPDHDFEAVCRKLGLDPKDYMSDNGYEPQQRTVTRRTMTAQPPTGPKQSEIDALLQDEGLLGALWRIKRWTHAALEALDVGWDDSRIVFGGTVRYAPDRIRGEGEPKTIADPGSKRGLWPRPEDIDGDEVWAVEGEPDAVSGWSAGLPCVAVPGVSGWRSEYAQGFARFRRVIVPADCDKQGRELREQICADLAPIVEEVIPLELAAKRTDKWDLGDALAEDVETPEELRAAGDELHKMAAAAEPFSLPPEHDKSPESTTKESLVVESGLSSYSGEWPEPMRQEAFYGPLGRLVRTIEPQTEGDPAAMLVTALLSFGSVLHRGPGIELDGRLHVTNEFAAIVGPTAKARKGTTRARIVQAFRLVDPEWIEDCLVDGLSTGEGLIYHVRDPVVVRRAPRTKGEREQVDDDGLLTEVQDAGVTDKRLMAGEEEFGRVLDSMHREGNTLSSVLRTLWDDGRARTLTRRDPLRTTGALVSLLAHSTTDELRRKLTDAEQANGFANRILFVCARRQRELPFGGKLTDADLQPIADELREAVLRARKVERVGWGSAAPTWASIYGELSGGPADAIFERVVARGDTHTVRLAMLYALADGSALIETAHLEAALAVWDYCERSAAYIWGGRLGNPDAERIREALRAAGDGGMTRTEIRDLFDRNLPAQRIEVALSQLRRRLLADVTTEATKGRPIERWRTRESSAGDPQEDAR